MNKYPLWKNLLIITVVLLGLYYAAPNLYPPDPAVQISSQSPEVVIGERDIKRAERALEQGGVDYKSVEIGDENLIVRLPDAETQLEARRVLQSKFLGEYVLALNLVPTTPDWLAQFGGKPMKLGLDLSGGVHFLLEVDTQSLVKARLETMEQDAKTLFRENDFKAADWSVRNEEDGLRFTFNSPELMSEGLALLRGEMNWFEERPETPRTDSRVKLYLTDAKVKELEDYAVSQNLTALRSRINSLGVAEPIVQRQGRNRIVLQLPGIQDTTKAKEIIGQTANLQFHLAARQSTLKSQIRRFPMKQNPNDMVELERRVILEGDCVEQAFPSYDQDSQPVTVLHLSSTCGRKMHRATAKNVGRNMGIVLVETKLLTREVEVDGETVIEEYPVEEKSVISYANIRSALGSQFQIEGLSQQEANRLSVLLRAGALAAPIFFVEERTVGPSLGADNIQKGMMSVQIGFALVVLFMLVYYRVFGIAAVTALLVNLVVLVACMSILGATLTLPGIAGIVLTVGMAVDANVLIFSRVKEELKNGLSPQMAISAGYDRAIVTILDANITTLLVAIILYAVGTGPIQGFAITLFIGILTSMFTAIMLTRSLVNAIYGGRNVKSLSI